MKNFGTVAAILTLAASAGHAGGLDRTYTPVDLLWEDGTYAELSFGYVNPSLTGSDNFGNAIANVAGDFGLVGAGFKLDWGTRYSFALIYDQPYGADTFYAGDPATTLLAGTAAEAETHALTALFKVQATDRISVYGGPRAVKANGEITLSGLAYGPASSYNVKFGSDTGLGYVVGGAYEIPDIALRAALTYHSAVKLDLNSIENLPVAIGGPGVPIPTGPTNTETPQSLALEFQTGVAKNTLAFGSVRWSEWSAFTLTPPVLGSNLAEFADTITYEIGIGRRFSEKFSASISISYEDGESDKLVSPLAPRNGETAVQLGGKYQISENVALSGGVRYTMFGDALPEVGTPDTPVGDFSGNDAISFGLKLGYTF